MIIRLDITFHHQDVWCVVFHLKPADGYGFDLDTNKPEEFVGMMFDYITKFIKWYGEIMTNPTFNVICDDKKYQLFALGIIDVLEQPIKDALKCIINKYPELMV